MSEKARIIIHSIEEAQGIEILKGRSFTFSDAEELYNLLSQDIPLGARPVFYEKILLDFFQNYFTFEAETSLLG